MSQVTSPVILDSTGQDIVTQLATISAALAADIVITGNTDTTLSGVLQGTNGKVGVKPVDASPTANSTNLVSSGGTDKAIKGRVPVYGMGKNLLDNWYFLNPVNQRGQTVYPATASQLYCIDRWNYQCRYGTVTLNSNGLNMAVTTASGANFFSQTIPGDALFNKQLTVSILDSQGNLRTFPVKVTAKNVNVDNTVTLDGVGMIIRINIGTNFVFTIRKDSTVFDITIQAVKLELGTEQTLCHNEGTSEAPVWVLNEIPDYEYELFRCMTSTGNSSDTYANKTLATGQELAYVENGTTASRAYAVEEYFCKGGLLYRVTAAISNGGTITPGTNCTAVTGGGFNDLGSLVITGSMTFSTSLSIAAGATASATESCASLIPAGYKLLAAIPAYSGDDQFCWVSSAYNVSNNNISVTIRNVSSTADSGKPTLALLFIRN